MRSIVHPNVNRAFDHGLQILKYEGVRQETRNGPALVHPLPLCTTYKHPQQRVLFSRVRRANPFFHLFEAFWMLAGRRDSAFLDQYVSDFGARYAEPGGNLHGAYGYRWRHWFTDLMDGEIFDQIEHAIQRLTDDPTDRQVVVAMWDPEVDFFGGKRDIPCNTHIYFRMIPYHTTRFITQGTNVVSHEVIDHVLDMTVCCRSNDAIWGLFGANAVHFSVLQEYVAWRLDCDIGQMHTLSNNFHVYESTLHLYDPMEPDHDYYSQADGQVTGSTTGMESIVAAKSLFSGADAGTFNQELRQWLVDPTNSSYGMAPVFGELLAPMARAHHAWKNGRDRQSALDLCSAIRHSDWKLAAETWLKQRKDR